MRIPGVLSRLSILLVIHTIFVFIVVSYVHSEHHHSSVERLTRTRLTEDLHLLRNELDLALETAAHQYGNSMSESKCSAALDKILHGSHDHQSPLAGLAICSQDSTGATNAIYASSWLVSDALHAEVLETRILGMIPPLAETGGEILIGKVTVADTAGYRTGIIPLVTDSGRPHLFMAGVFDSQKMFFPADSPGYLLTVLFLATTLISLLMVNLIYRSFVRPLAHVVQGMEKTAEGKLHYQIEDCPKGDIGRVAKAFNVMSSRLWERRQALAVSNQALSEANKKLVKTLEELSIVNASLLESESFLSELIDNAPLPVIATERDHKMVIVSRTAMRIFGISDESEEYSDIRRLFPYVPEKLFAPDQAEADILQKEMVCQKLSGDRFPALVTRVGIRDDSGGVKTYLYFIRDISESRNFQEMMVSLDRMVTRGEMAGEIAHEINNYLAIILGNIELLPILFDRNDQAEIQKKLDLLKTTIGKIGGFAEGLMNYGEDTAVLTPDDLNQLIENLVAFLRPQNRYNKVEFELNLSDKLPLVMFDSNQMQQLLVNLITNACDAMRDAPRADHLTIATEFLADHDQVIICVTDCGCGIPDNIAKKLFVKRYTSKANGHGYGLLISKKIIENHGGHIDFSSEVGSGTTFRVMLPVRCSPDSAPGSRAPADQAVKA
jgi:PAS domain S-box-containing protein